MIVRTDMITKMILSLVFCISLLSFSIIQTTIGCDIIMRVKSLTHTPFHAQIIAPDGNSSEKLVFFFFLNI
ncbi:unnamed protein product [Wuchereria bancrofti]|uniref:Uncharacterized protein n=1 Tax=Wuchereria bancrofti TaxID=6293 RepID=A0A3P7EHM0_WUCBA|nr:unnamed protein product [Wuchereria bancrofti]